MKRVLTFALFGALLAGCGGGGGSTPSTSATTPQGTKVPVTFRIDVPPGSTAAHRRSAQYISPATTQLVIDVHLSGYSVPGFPTTVPLTPGSSNCTTTLSTTYCQFTVNLSFNTYAAIITAEDANGTPLSATQVQFTVSNGQTVFPLTLSGIPAKLQVAPGALAVHGPSPSGFTLYGSAPQNLVVAALDADGNIIVGPGAPTFTASVVSGSGWSVGTPASTAPNLLAITPPGTNGSGATVQVTANYPDYTCQDAGAVCTTSFAIKNDIQQLWVADFSNSVVREYTPPYTGVVSTTITNGLNLPSALALDAAGDLFVLNYGSQSVTEYQGSYAGAPSVSITAGIQVPYAMVVDGSRNVFVANAGSNSVTVYAPPYNAVTTTISSGISFPYALALDGSGNLFIANNATSTVSEFAPPYTGAAVATITNGVYLPVALTLDAAGELFVANQNGSVTVYEPPYTGSPTVIQSGIDLADGLLVDPSGTLFVANESSAEVTYYAAPYSNLTGTISGGLASPAALALDGAGNLLVANRGTGTVYEYAPPYNGAPIASIGGLTLPYALQLTP